jgi:small GTP-binding protein
LIHRLKTGQFVEGTKMTIGVDFFPYDTFIDEKKVTLQIWDLGGQERFQFMHQAYVKGGALAILAYDLSRFSTFKGLLNTWLGIVRAFNPSMPLILVGTKLDLVTPQELDLLKSNPDLQKLDYWDHLFVSSKNGVGVQDLFRIVAQKLVEKEKPVDEDED